MNRYELMTDNELASAAGHESDAAVELLRRQREGRALRVYPYGRSSVDEEGVSPLVVTANHNEKTVTIEAGVNRRFILKPRNLDVFIPPAATVLKWYKEKIESGLSPAFAARLLSKKETDGLEFHIETNTANSFITMEISPVDRQTWVVGFRGMISLIRQIGESAKELDVRFHGPSMDELLSVLDQVCDELPQEDS